MKQHDQHTELIAKHLANETTEREKEELFAWMNEDGANKKFVDEMAQVWEMSATAGAQPFEPDFEKAWAKIDDATAASSQSAKVVPLSKIMRRWSVAAALLLAIAAGLWWWLRPEPTRIVEVRTFYHQKKEVTLPDGSHIWLNDHSTLTYDARFAERNVALDGEAFFQVEHMKTHPFRISSGEVTTSVLGTSFNVRAYAGEKQVEVTVETGKVGLAPADKKKSSIVLPAGSSGIFDKKTHEVRLTQQKIPNAVAWKNRVLFFDDTLMKDIIETLERYFEVDISVSNDLIYNCHYTVSFEQPSLEEVFKILSGTFNLEITRKDGGYLLSGEGCR
ncbi:MAG: DUF4974 domain-containing protein [Saprospiraceae bacterium]|nr:MAG: DUF4974 domain-containing protein [Saprospiraceae bacterium]